MSGIIEILSRDGGPSIAYARFPGSKGNMATPARPGIVFMGGLMSDMSGIKATWLEDFARCEGLPYVRFDYSGHGASQGRFEDGTIGSWLADSLLVLDGLTQGPQVLVGSSMGGWLAFLCALARPDSVRGIVGIAAAPDFTQELIHSEFTAEQREMLIRDGVVYVDTPYGDKPYAFTRALIEEGRDHLILGAPITVRCPVRLIHGYNDADVPWETAMAIMARLEGDDSAVTLVKDGDHRLSRAQDLVKIGAAITDIIGPGAEAVRGSAQG